MSKRTVGWSLAIVANALLWCVLGLGETSTAAPQPGKQPFANAVQQRGEMVKHLKEITILLREQNRLLRAQQNAKSETLPR